MKSPNNIIESLLVKAIEGSLELDDLYERWPQELVGSSYDQIYSDIEDAVEHTPGFFFKRGVDSKAWLRQTERTKLVIDLALIKRCDPSSPEWMQLLREAESLVSSHPKKTDDEIRNLVANMNNKLE